VVLSVDAPDEKSWRRELEIIAAAVNGRASGPPISSLPSGTDDFGADA